MPQIQMPLVRGDKVEEGGDYGDFLPKNFVAIPKEVLGAGGYMLAHDGLLRKMTAAGIDRGAFYNDRSNKHFRISGNSLITVDSASSYTTIGTVDGSGQCSMPYSFQSQLVVSGGNVYRYAGGTLTKLTDADFGRPIDADWIDGYYFFTDGEYLYHTLLADETQVAPTDYAVAEIMPDKSLGVMRTADNLMMVFGRYTIEYFINDGSTNFAFQRIAQKSLKVGICGTYCKAEIAGQVYILGGRRLESPAIHVVSAGGADPISTRTVNKILQTYSETELAMCVLESRVRFGMTYLIVRLPNHTLMFNITAAQAVGAAQAWSILSTGVDGGRWIGVNGVYDPNLSEWVYGSNVDGGVYHLDQYSTAQDGQYSECELQTPLMPVDKKRVSQLMLTTVSGFSSENTAIFCSTSSDGYVVSGEWTELYSPPSDYNKEFYVRRLGFFPNKVFFRFRSVTKDPINISNLMLTVS